MRTPLVDSLGRTAIALLLTACGTPAMTLDAGDASHAEAASNTDAHPTLDVAPSSDAPLSTDVLAAGDTGASVPDATTDACIGGGCAAPYYSGVNLSGAEFDPGALPGTAGTTYAYPTPAEFDYFHAHGMHVVRLPFLWERLQRTLGAGFDAGEIARLDAAVSYGTGLGMIVLIDPHDYARYDGAVIGQTGSPVSTALFADFWARLAGHYLTNPNVWFGLMNEPNGMPTELWLTDANAAIASIRGAGATQWILVPGNGYTGAHAWSDTWYGTANATVMTGVVDPMNHFMYEMHQYLDSDSSGTHPDCVDATAAVATLQGATTWARAHGQRIFLGEVGVSSTAACLASVDALLTFMDGNRDVWSGYSWWAAGAWWGSYMFSIEPSGTTDAPQMAVLDRHRGS